MMPLGKQSSAAMDAFAWAPTGGSPHCALSVGYWVHLPMMRDPSMQTGRQPRRFSHISIMVAGSAHRAALRAGKPRSTGAAGARAWGRCAHRTSTETPKLAEAPPV